MKIAKYEKRYFSQVAKIHVDSFGVISQTKAAVENFGDGGDLTLVAIDEKDRVVGYIYGRPQGKNVYLGWFGVKKSARGKGVGSLLLKSFSAWANKRQANYIILDTRNRFRDAIIMYLKFGYDIFGTHLADNGEMMIRLRRKL